MTLEQKIQKIEDWVKTQDYCWFRFTYSQIGGVQPKWVVWIENISGRGSAPTTGATLEEALEPQLRFIEAKKFSKTKSK